MKNFTMLCWMVFAVILMVGILKESPTDKPTPQPAPTPTSTIIVEKEKRIVSLLLSVEDRKQICSQVAVRMDGEKLEQIDCVTKDGNTIHYSAVAEGALGFTTNTGDIVSDDQIDGSVDYGSDKNGGEKFFHEFRLNYTQGEENREHWQTELEKLIESVNSVSNNKRSFEHNVEASLFMGCR